MAIINLNGSNKVVNKNNIKLHFFTKPIVIGWMLLVCNFGALLFFSPNGDIMNPNMPIWPALVKDVLWLAFLTCVFCAIPMRPQRSLFVILITIGLLILAVGICVVYYQWFHIDLNSIKAIKNSLLYMLAPLAMVWLSLIHI